MKCLIQILTEYNESKGYWEGRMSALEDIHDFLMEGKNNELHERSC